MVLVGNVALTPTWRIGSGLSARHCCGLSVLVRPKMCAHDELSMVTLPVEPVESYRGFAVRPYGSAGVNRSASRSGKSIMVTRSSGRGTAQSLGYLAENQLIRYSERSW